MNTPIEFINAAQADFRKAMAAAASQSPNEFFGNGLGNKEPRELLYEYLVNQYKLERRIWADIQLGNDMGPEAVDQEMEKAIRNETAFLRNLKDSPTPISVNFGSASPKTLQYPDSIVDQVSLLLHLAKNAGDHGDEGSKYSCLSGSSVSGWMGLIHKAYIEAGCEMYDIPLAPVSQDLPEAPPHGVKEGHRSSGHLLLGPRTACFGLAKAAAFFVWPGGIGSNEEAWSFMAGSDLRGPLLTPFSHLINSPKIPPMFFIDYKRTLTMLDHLQSSEWVRAKQYLERAGEGWRWEGLYQEMLCSIAGGHAKHHSFNHVTFIRIGEADNTPDGETPRIRYFQKREDAASYIDEKMEEFTRIAYPEFV